jgi:hypothetical protein
MRNHSSFNLNINVVHGDDVACHCRRFSHVDLPDLTIPRARRVRFTPEMTRAARINATCLIIRLL